MAEYCLRWNNHQPNLVTVFSELLNAESLVDVTLATDGHFIHAHKLVLSACSVYFKDLFGSNPCKHPIVFLKDIKIEDLKTVIDFIYRGEVNVSQERLQDVLKTAESLRIKGLADKPFNYDEYPSQSRGQHLSSSFSSQRSSLTDSREQTQSVDAEDLVDVSGNSPPATKKRKVVSSQDSSDGVQETNHDGEDVPRSEGGKEESQKKSSSATVNDEGSKTPHLSKDKMKEEKDGTATTTGSSDSRPEFQESRAADAMLLLQGSSSEGGGDEGGTASTTPSSNARGDSSSGLLSSHSQGFPGRPSQSISHRAGSIPLHSERGGSPRMMDPYLYGNCLIVRPKLKASDGSYVTIRTGTAENFLQAVEDVREGKMGFCKAGKIYGVNHATLQKFYKAMGYSVRNRSNNPNFMKSPPPSEREENETEPSNLSQEDYDDDFQYGSYASPRAFYQHFLTPNSEYGRLTPFDTQRTGSSKGTSAATTGTATTATSTASSNRTASRTSPSVDNLSSRLESFSSGRLLNYSSYYCEATNMAEEAEKQSQQQQQQQQQQLHSQIHPPSGSAQNQTTPLQSDTNVLDINHPIVLCNL